MKEKKKIIFLGLILLPLLVLVYFAMEDNGAPSVLDRTPPPRDTEGYTYETVEVGNQVWFAENLKTTGHEQGESFCYKDDERNCEIYGRLYDWDAARVSCPEGWRLPSDEDWTKLQQYISDDEMIGSKLKSQDFWMLEEGESDGDYPRTDEYGLSFLPSGQYFDGYFYDLGRSGFWWTSTNVQDSQPVWSRSLLYESNELTRSIFGPEHAFAVRCMRDKDVQTEVETQEEVFEVLEPELEIDIREEEEEEIVNEEMN